MFWIDKFPVNFSSFPPQQTTPSLVALVFYPGRLLTSRESVPARDSAGYFSLDQRVVDKRDVQKTEECEEDPGYDEDACLMR